MHIPQNQQNSHNKDDKLVTEVTKELDSFKQRFFRLIDKAQGKKLEQLEAHRKMVLSDNKYDIHYVDRILSANVFNVLSSNGPKGTISYLAS
jgi:hypothetical protein